MSRSRGRGLRGHRVLVGLLIAGAACWSATATAQRVIGDYRYGHVIEGVVLTEEGTPVPGAAVVRARDARGGEPYNQTDLYRRTTGADGGFRFEHTGLGPRPRAADTWHLAVRSDHCDPRVETFRAPWETRGYVREGIVLRLTGCRDLPPPPEPPPPTALERAWSGLPATKRTVLTRALTHHREAQELRRRSAYEDDPELMGPARQQYALAAEAYASVLPLDDAVVDLEMQRNLADAHYWGESYEEAASLGARVRDRLDDPGARERVARAVVMARERLLARARDEGRVPPPPLEGQAPLPPAVQDLFDAREAYLSLTTESATRARYAQQNAEALVHYGHLAEALTRLRRIRRVQCRRADDVQVAADADTLLRVLDPDGAQPEACAALTPRP